MFLQKKMRLIILTIIMLFPLSITSYVHAASSTILTVGSSGDAVVQLQTALKQKGYFNYNVTGYFGYITRDAVMRFQKDYGLIVDGIAGPQTLTALYNSGTTAILTVGSSGDAVVQLQTTLKQKGYFNYNVTGYFGYITRDAVMRFQKDYGLIVDGIAGPQTLTALYNSGTTAMPSRGDSANYREDIYWLSRIIEAEAGAEPYIGKVAVGNVIMNRVNSPYFPNTVKDVIFQYYNGIPQFSPVADGTIYNTPSQDSINAALEAYNGAKPVGDALYFFNPAKAEGGWIIRNKIYVTTIGNHSFYR